MIYLFLGISIILNILLSWFCYKVVRKFLNHSENIYFLMDRMDDFTAHLSATYELEMFYGDETLKGLLEHSKNLKEDIGFYKSEYILEIESEEETEDEEEIEDEDEEKEDDAP